MLLSGEHAYLADFGLTRFAGADTLTTAGHFLGTVDYMAPEQFHPGPNDARADVYALGCVLFAALTGAPPFLRETVPATMLAHLHDKPPRASLTAGRAAGFDRVLARALAKSPEDRYPSAGDFGRAALAAAEGRSVTEEERSVARGAAAPTVRREGRLWSGLKELPPVAPDPVEEQVPPAPGEPAPIRRYRARRPRRLWAWGSGVVRRRRRGGRDRGRARRRRHAAAGRAGLLRRGRADGELVRLGLRRRGRGAHLAAADLRRAARLARRQPDRAARRRRRLQEPVRRATRITGFELDDLSAEGGPSGRATARYTVTYDGAEADHGQMTWIVISEQGRPRISLIAFRPDP